MSGIENLEFIPISELDTAGTTAVAEEKIDATSTQDGPNESVVAATVVNGKEKEVSTVTNEIEPEALFTSFSKMSGGVINSSEALKVVLEGYQSKLDLEKSYDDLKSQYEITVNKNPFANEYIQKLNDLYQSGASAETVKAFQEINRIGDLSKLSSEDALVYQMQLKHPTISEDEARHYVRDTYDLDEFGEDEGYHAKATHLKIEAESAVKFLEQHKASFDVKETPKESNKGIDLEKLMRERTQQAEPIIYKIEQELANEFKGMNANGLSGEKAFQIDYELPDAIKTEAISMAKQFAIDSGADLSDKEVHTGIKEYAKNVALLKSFPYIIADAVNKKEQALLQEFHNPSNIHRGHKNPDRSVSEIESLMSNANKILLGN